MIRVVNKSGVLCRARTLLEMQHVLDDAVSRGDLSVFAAPELLRIVDERDREVCRAELVLSLMTALDRAIEEGQRTLTETQAA